MTTHNYLVKNISRYWRLAHYAFLVLLVVYFILKTFIFKHKALSGLMEMPAKFDVFSFSIMLIGLLLFILSVMLLYKSRIIYIVILIFTGYFLLSIGYILQADPELKWPGSDVAWNNFLASKETIKFGALYIIDTWNAQANPFAKRDIFPEAMEIARKFIQKYNLYFLSGNRWNKRELFLDLHNNRPYIHPPLAPMFLSIWLILFPYERWSAELFMIVLDILVIVIIFLSSYRSQRSIGQLSILLILCSNSAMIIFNSPSAEQLAMLLLTLSIVVVCAKKDWGFLRLYISGILIGLALFTKFIIIIYIAMLFILFFIFMYKIGWKPMLGYFSGIATVIIIFTLLGYYFWLTVITGSAISKTFMMLGPVSTFDGISKFFYFGPALLLLTLLATTAYQSEKFDFKDKLLLYSLLASMVIYSITMWKLGALNRYLMTFIMPLFLFIYPLADELKLSKKDVLLIPVTNVIFIFLITYF